jgi:hypothetical protein
MANKFARASVFSVFVLVASSAFGQSGATGTVLGSVTNISGAPMPRASIAVTNMASGVTKRTSTNSAGTFVLEYLSPGTYELQVSAKGYGKTIVRNIGLVVAQRAREDIRLKAGEVPDTIIDEANAVKLDTESAAVSQTVVQQQVNDLPLNGRNFLSLLFIGAGAVETNGEMGQMREGEGNAISMNGGRPESSNYTLDGLANTDTALNTPAVILSQDDIQEFRVQNETYSAEYGFSANQVNIVSKGGTNRLHGSIFEFARNDALDAKGLFEPSVPKLIQNQFGFLADGPVYLPKVFDGRNTTFWLADYEGWRIRNGTNLFGTVPTMAELQGNFSGTGLPAFGSQACNAALAQDLPCMPVNPVTGMAYQSNTIPTSSFSRIAQVEIADGVVPTPNCIGCPQGNYRLNTVLPNEVNQQTYRLDENLGRWGGIFVRYTDSNFSNQQISGSVSVPAGVSVFMENTQSWEVSHTAAFGTYLNNFRFGRLDPVANQGGIPASASAVSAMGIAGTFQNIPNPYRLYPTIGLDPPVNYFGSQQNDSTTSDVPMWDLADSVAHVHGRHTLNLGIDFRKWIQKRNTSSDYLGDIDFNNDTVAGNGTGCLNSTGLCGTGNAIADFLLGYYGQASTFQPGPFSKPGVVGNLNQYHFLYFAPFIQDDWKATDRLAFSLGLRWDYRAVPFEQDNKMFWLDAANPAGGVCMADQSLETQNVPALGGPIAPVGNGFYRYCGRRNPANGSKKPFAPRVGLAYQPIGDKTVFRAGYGIFFDSSETREIDDSGDVYPFVVRTILLPTGDPTAPKTTDNLFPPVTLHAVTPSIDGNQFFAVIVSEHPRNPYEQQWSLSVERELAKNTTIEANYVGSRGTHLLDRENIGQPLPPSDPALCASNPTAGDCPISVRKPYANIVSPLGFLDSRWEGYSDYNGANLKIERRTSTMALLAVYTWSKSMDDKSAAAGLGATNSWAGHMDEHDPRLDYAPSDFDTPQRFVASYLYQLPFGRGHRFGGSMNKIADWAVGDWEITGITTFQKGFPFSVLCNDVDGLLITFVQRCNLVGDPGSPHGSSDWFNTAAFQQPLPGQFGDSGRNILREPGINNWDVGIDKTFAFNEKVHFQLRLETFNAFNHADLGLDPTVPGVLAGNSAVVNQFGAAGFGTVTVARPGRIAQLGGKITF